MWSSLVGPHYRSILIQALLLLWIIWVYKNVSIVLPFWCVQIVQKWASKSVSLKYSPTFTQRAVVSRWKINLKVTPFYLQVDVYSRLCRNAFYSSLCFDLTWVSVRSKSLKHIIMMGPVQTCCQHRSHFEDLLHVILIRLNANCLRAFFLWGFS